MSARSSRPSAADAAAAAATLGIAPAAVSVATQMAGGGFGRRAIPSSDYVVEACQVAKAARAAGLNTPVRTLWSREDDIRGGYYRPMHLHTARIGFDDRVSTIDLRVDYLRQAIGPHFTARGQACPLISCAMGSIGWSRSSRTPS